MTSQIKQRIEQIRRGEVPEGYKKTKVGIVPTEWTDCNMGEIYSERKEAGNPTLPILTVSIHSGVSNGELDESGLGKKVKRIEDKTQYLTARKGDLVFNMMRAWQGAIGVVQADGLVSPAYIVAKPTVKVCSAFMDEYIKLPESINRLRKKSYGVTDFRLRLYWDSFVKVDCCIPTLAEQDKIAEILTAQDRVIELCEKKVEQLKKLKKVFLQKMFPKPGATVPEWRFPGFTDAWEQRKFSDFTWNAGKRNSENLDLEPYAVTNDRGFIRQNEAHDEFGYMKDVDRKAYNIVMPNSFAYNPARINVGSIGYYEGRENVIVSSLYEVFQTADYVEDRFLWHWFKSDVFPKWIERLQEGSVRLYFYYDKLCECQMFMPSIQEQRKIAEVLDTLDNTITLHQRKCDEEKQKKKALMQLLLTGIVRT